MAFSQAFPFNVSPENHQLRKLYSEALSPSTCLFDVSDFFYQKEDEKLSYMNRVYAAEKRKTSVGHKHIKQFQPDSLRTIKTEIE